MLIDIYNPPCKFQLIAADPPWDYSSRGARSGRFGDLPYSYMTTGDIAALPVATLADDTAILQLWFTASFGEEAYQVCRAWGFTPVRIDRVWAKRTKNDKPHSVPGPWGSTDVEFILLGTRGKAHSKLLTDSKGYTLCPERYPGQHSGKPRAFYADMDRRFGNAHMKLEMFARQTALGWCCWGDDPALRQEAHR